MISILKGHILHPSGLYCLRLDVLFLFVSLSLSVWQVLQCSRTAPLHSKSLIRSDGSRRPRGRRSLSGSDSLHTFQERVHRRPRDVNGVIAIVCNVDAATIITVVAPVAASPDIEAREDSRGHRGQRQQQQLRKRQHRRRLLSFLRKLATFSPCG